MSKELGLYLTSAMNQSIHNHQKKKYSRGYKAIWTGRVENDDILLPIQTSHDGKPIIDPDRTYHPDGYIPDWGVYGKKYIKATEKEIIKEVVLYKDKVIAKAKEIAGEKRWFNERNKKNIGKRNEQKRRTAELVKVPPEREAEQEIAGQAEPRCGRAGEDDWESGCEVMDAGEEKMKNDMGQKPALDFDSAGGV